ncbi:UNVERIFIED_CONTAM: hypothetical protein Slati_0896500 [Sesamum latifolium]|uniref:Reverse transcriptase domain-containing protein n=1 Tax=Sesamum latifolium TaxID=2727402 RepID=A0AAW2XPQ8_9LAMI
MPRSSMTGKAEVNDPPRKGVIRMIIGGPVGGDSQRARKAQVREACGTLVREVMEVEPTNDAPLIQFDQEELCGPRTQGNDALVITALLTNYEIERVFIDSGSSTDILFVEAEVVHPRGMISLPLTLGTSPIRKTCLLKFLVVDIPLAYNVILGRPTLNTFRAIISTYHMKIKFPIIGGVGDEAQADTLQAHKYYVEAIKKGNKRGLEGTPREVKFNKWGKEPVPSPEPKEEAPVTVQPVEELLSVELIPEEQRHLRIDSPGLGGDRPGVITHHFNLDPNVRPVKQKKRHFGPEKDKIIQEEVNKLLAAGDIREIQFPEWLSNVVLVPKLGGKWRMYIDFRDLNKACPEDFYPLPRIDQLVDSTSECELLSMMNASQGYHQIILAPKDHKRTNFITSDDTFCYVAMPFGLKNAGATYQILVNKIFRPQLGRNMEVYVDDMLVKSK